MRLFNWRRQAVLNAMPLVKPDQVRTPWHEFWRRFRRQHMAMTAALFVILLIVVAIFARWIAPYDAENYFDYDNLNNGPSLQHWFGVDSLGRDIFSRVWLVRKSRWRRACLPCLSVRRSGRCWACWLDIMKAGGIG
ncbi:hypothetical protein ECZU08_31600 [Escherichia coli]|nr:hypothetical protein ECZU08_31600 [Escherichia coli]